MKIYNNDQQLTKVNIISPHPELEVIGSYIHNSRECLVVACSKCTDKELYGSCLFEVEKRKFITGYKPCGCSRTIYWEDWQAEVLMQRKALKDGYTFVGWPAKYNGSRTRTMFRCEKHGIWEGSIINDCKRYDIVCPGCWSDKMSNINRKEDCSMISNFLSTEQFHPETLFTRSDKKAPNGYREFWNVFCPDCSTEYIANYKKLSVGYRGCECSGFRQKELYINILYDSETPIALKFGIANNAELRLRSIQKKTTLVVKQYAVWLFDTIVECKSTELDIKHNFTTSVLSKALLPDGHTETASLLDFQGICEFLDKKTRRKPQQPS